MPRQPAPAQIDPLISQCRQLAGETTHSLALRFGLLVGQLPPPYTASSFLQLCDAVTRTFINAGLLRSFFPRVDKSTRRASTASRTAASHWQVEVAHLLLDFAGAPTSLNFWAETRKLSNRQPNYEAARAAIRRHAEARVAAVGKIGASRSRRFLRIDIQNALAEFPKPDHDHDHESEPDHDHDHEGEPDHDHDHESEPDHDHDHDSELARATPALEEPGEPDPVQPEEPDLDPGFEPVPDIEAARHRPQETPFEMDLLNGVHSPHSPSTDAGFAGFDDAPSFENDAGFAEQMAGVIDAAIDQSGLTRTPPHRSIASDGRSPRVEEDGSLAPSAVASDDSFEGLPMPTIPSPATRTPPIEVARRKRELDLSPSKSVGGPTKKTTITIGGDDMVGTEFPSSLESLIPPHWLRGDVINACLSEMAIGSAGCILAIDSLEEAAERIHPKVADRLRTAWTQRQGTVLVPVHVDGNHWLLLELTLDKQSGLVFDSLGSVNVLGKVRNRLGQLFERCDMALDVESWQLDLARHPQQHDSYSCGTATLMAAFYRVAGVEHMPCPDYLLWARLIAVFLTTRLQCGAQDLQVLAKIRKMHDRTFRYDAVTVDYTIWGDAARPDDETITKLGVRSPDVPLQASLEATRRRLKLLEAQQVSVEQLRVKCQIALANAKTVWRALLEQVRPRVETGEALAAELQDFLAFRSQCCSLAVAHRARWTTHGEEWTAGAEKERESAEARLSQHTRSLDGLRRYRDAVVGVLEEVDRMEDDIMSGKSLEPAGTASTGVSLGTV